MLCTAFVIFSYTLCKSYRDNNIDNYHKKAIGSYGPQTPNSTTKNKKDEEESQTD